MSEHSILREAIARALWQYDNDNDIDGSSWDDARHEQEGLRLYDMARMVEQEALFVTDPAEDRISALLGIDYSDPSQRAAGVMQVPIREVRQALIRARQAQGMNEHDLAGALGISVDEAMELETYATHLKDLRSHALAVGMTIVPVLVDLWEVQQ